MNQQPLCIEFSNTDIALEGIPCDLFNHETTMSYKGTN
jgi:hypothetical protein